MTLLKSLHNHDRRVRRAARRRRAGFTLLELLMVVAIIAIISTLGLAVLGGAEQDALENRTRAGIQRIKQALDQKLEENAYRILPIRPAPGTSPVDLADLRQIAFAELIRVEFPTRIEHAVVANYPRNTGTLAGIELSTGLPVPQMLRRFEERLNAVADPSTQYESAECLYAIMSLHYDEQGNSLVSLLRKREIADLDGDGRPEVVDAFGDPLEFEIFDRENKVLDPLDPNEPLYNYVVIRSRNLEDQ